MALLQGSPIGWDDIAGLQFAKDTVKEIVVWPMMRPDIFTGQSWHLRLDILGQNEGNQSVPKCYFNPVQGSAAPPRASSCSGRQAPARLS